MNSSLDSSSSRRLPTRSKTLPALPSEDQNVEYEVSLSRSFTIGATGASDKHSMNMSGHVKSLSEVKEDEQDNDDDAEAEAQSKDVDPHPRQRSTSGQSVNRDYFVYADSAASPTIHLRKAPHKSKTIHTAHPPRARRPPPSPDALARSQSLGVGSSYTRVRVDDGSFWKKTGDQDSPDGSQRQYGTIITPTTDNDTKNGKETDTLPTIPGSSASSSDTPGSFPALPEKGPPPDLTDTPSSPTISPPIKLQPRGPSSKRSSAERPRRHEITRINTSTEPPKHHLAHQLDLSPDSSNTIEEHKPHRQSATGAAPGRSSLPSFPTGTRFFERPPPVADFSAPEPPRKEPYTTTHASKEGSTRPSNPDLPPPKSGRGHRVSFTRGSDIKAPITPEPPSSRTNRDENRSSLQLPHTEGKENEHDEETGHDMTRYMRMLLALDKIPRIHNLAASFFTWILLAGFVLFPGTFTSIRNSGLNTNTGSGITGDVVKSVLNTVNHVSLFVIAFLCCGIGASGMSYLWWRWMKNYLWLVNKIFLPGLMNSLAGVISTLSSVYGAQHGEFSTTSKITLIVTGSAMLICAVLTAYYMLWMIRRVKLEHDRIVGEQRTGKHGEGLVERIKRKANEESGSAGGFAGL